MGRKENRARRAKQAMNKLATRADVAMILQQYEIESVDPIRGRLNLFVQQITQLEKQVKWLRLPWWKRIFRRGP